MSPEAKAYRTELRRTFNMHCGVCRGCRPATAAERLWRARRDYRHIVREPEDAAWTVEDIVARLVAHRFPAEVAGGDPAQPPRMSAVGTACWAKQEGDSEAQILGDSVERGANRQRMLTVTALLLG